MHAYGAGNQSSRRSLHVLHLHRYSVRKLVAIPPNVYFCLCIYLVLEKDVLAKKNITFSPALPLWSSVCLMFRLRATLGSWEFFKRAPSSLWKNKIKKTGAANCDRLTLHCLSIQAPGPRFLISSQRSWLIDEQSN